MAKIGVFVCDCGNNIARTVDTPDVTRDAAEQNGVAFVENHKFMCSNPGQESFKKAIRDEGLDGCIVAACSPKMHEATFRNAAEAAGLNPFRVEIANIREHCSWVHDDKEIGTVKAKDLTKMMVERIKFNRPLERYLMPLTKRALIIGGGIAGIQAALDLGNAGYSVTIVEKEPSLGGNMARLSETFPTLDCSQCILTPKMVEVQNHPNITVHAYAEMEKLEGYIGNFRATIRQKAKSVIDSECTGCGECWEKCPFTAESEFDMNLNPRKLIYMPFPQAVPTVPVIDRENCPKFLKDSCGLCADVCGPDCIDFTQQDEIIEEEFGAVIVATGYKLMPNVYPEYGGTRPQHMTPKKLTKKLKKLQPRSTAGRLVDVINGMEFERLASASGPTGGEIRRPSDGKKPESIAFIACVGSRDCNKGVEYCSKICCMYTAKHTMLYNHSNHEGKAYVFYMDIRAGGKGYEEFINRAQSDGTEYIRGRVSRLSKKGDKILVKGADTLLGEALDIEVDMVVLATAMVPQEDAIDLAKVIGISYDQHGFYSEQHPKLMPVDSSTGGIYLAGACQGVKDIPETVAQASAAASKVMQLFSKEELQREPEVAIVDQEFCMNCWDCVTVCPYLAISREEKRDRNGNLQKMVATVNPGLCQGCGICNTVCRSKSISLQGYTDEQVYAQITAFDGAFV
ncbi:MAG: CoB--CoM heterodisulfide reductase iron-sulfur subunit A family protein [Candidatus Sedimenticola sp. (ex Thyasira tokunagai)]